MALNERKQKIVQQALCSESGNVILLKDRLSNLAANIKKRWWLGWYSQNANGKVWYVTCEWWVELIFFVAIGAHVEISVDNNRGLFVQDKQMKNAFEAYPELICIDATYISYT